MSRAMLLDTVDAVLFDLDGTLLDTAPDLVHALHAVCDEQRQPRPDARLAARYVSTGAIGLVRLAFPERDAAATEALRQRLVDFYEQRLCAGTAPYDGVTALLDQLAERTIRWGVVTNKLRYLALPLLEQLDMARQCSTLVGGDTAARNKPHPDPIEHALAELGVPAERAIYVGDARKDIEAGRAAGVRTVAVTWGYILPGEEPHAWNADYTINHPGELLLL
jgi:phosphoglycolate phosphatase